MIANALKKSSGINYPGLIAAWSAKGKTNDDEDRAILKDLTGNGHDITLNGFAFSEMSGYGGYSINFKNEYTNRIFENRAEGVVTQNKMIVTSIKDTNNFFEDLKTSNIHPSYKIKATGVSEELYIRYMYSSDKSYDIKTEGIHVIPESEAIRYVGFRANKIVESCNITIELIPEYPDALVFDGVDDYGINEDMPILTDYTVIVNRRYIETERSSCLISKAAGVSEGAFIMELIEGDLNKTYNYSFNNFIRSKLYTSTGISWLNTTSYNGIRVNKGYGIDTNDIFIGAVRKLDNRRFKGAFYSAYLFDRSLDEQEIKAFIRKYIDSEYLLPSEIPTPDCYYDFSQGSNDDENRETIKDQSGNGNDAKAYNIAWNEEGSGYKDGALYLDGVDDYVALEAFNSGFKTVFALCNPFILNKIIYDQCKREVGLIYRIYNTEGSIAYNVQNEGGYTYINGNINNSVLSDDLINKKHLITILNDNDISVNSTTPNIGKPTDMNAYRMNMAIYKFLGFKEELTEEQIQAIIKKYNLLDGVDKIEVS